MFDRVAMEQIEEVRDLCYRLLPHPRFTVVGGLPTTGMAGLRLQSVKAGKPQWPLLPLAGDRHA